MKEYETMLNNAQKRDREYQRMLNDNEEQIKQLLEENRKYEEELSEKNTLISNYQKKLKQQVSQNDPLTPIGGAPSPSFRMNPHSGSGQVTNVNYVNQPREQQKAKDLHNLADRISKLTENLDTKLQRVAQYDFNIKISKIKNARLAGKLKLEQEKVADLTMKMYAFSLVQ